MIQTARYPNDSESSGWIIIVLGAIFSLQGGVSGLLCPGVFAVRYWVNNTISKNDWGYFSIKTGISVALAFIIAVGLMLQS